MTTGLPLVIINPAARGGKAGRSWAFAATVIRSHFGPYQCAFTTRQGDAARIAEEEARAGRQFIVSFGGDGTISEVARGILRSGAAAELGVLPQGTGADFLRTLAVPSRLADAARALRHGRPKAIDIGEVTFTAHDGTSESRFFINSASFGLSGEVASRTNRGNLGGGRIRFGGAIAYATETMKAALAFDPPSVWLQIGTDAARRVPITQVSVNNGKFFGGGMKIAPHASLVDGLLDLVVVRKLSFARIAADGPRIYSGTHLSLPEVTHAQVGTVRAWPVTEHAEIGLEVDGETPGVLPARFSVRPSALRIRVVGREPMGV